MTRTTRRRYAAVTWIELGILFALYVAAIVVILGLISERALAGEIRDPRIRDEVLAGVSSTMRAGCLARLAGRPRPAIPSTTGPIGSRPSSAAIRQVSAVSGWSVCDWKLQYIAGGRSLPSDPDPFVCVTTSSRLAAHTVCR